MGSHILIPCGPAGEGRDGALGPYGWQNHRRLCGGAGGEKGWISGWKEGKVWKGLFLVSPHLDFSQPGVCVCVSIFLCLLCSIFWGLHFSVLLPPWIGTELSDSLCTGDLNLGQAELHQVRSGLLMVRGWGLLVRVRGKCKSTLTPASL